MRRGERREKREKRERKRDEDKGEEEERGREREKRGKGRGGEEEKGDISNACPYFCVSNACPKQGLLSETVTPSIFPTEGPKIQDMNGKV